MNTPTFVRLTAQASPASFRTEVYNGVDTLVAPFVALVSEIVVEGMLSEGPEYVPAAVLAAAPSSFDGRPIVNVHPDDGQSGANTPGGWENLVYGQVFGSKFEDGRLKVECWFNPAQAERVGPDAVEVLNKVRKSELVEVSVGAWVWLEDEEGIAPDGNKYVSKWISCCWDHLAVGLQSQGSGKGACSVERGCGGPRTLSAKQAIAIKENADMEPSLISQLTAKLGKAGIEALAEGMSDSELRQKLNRALRAIVPAFFGVEQVFSQSSSAIFAAMPGDSVEFWECSYTLSDKGEVSIGRRKQVEPVTEWKKVAKADAQLEALETVKENLSVALKTNCSCHEAANGDPAAGGNEPPNKGKGDEMSQKSQEPTAAAVELAGRLIANSAAPFKDTPPAVLAALGETQLTALNEKYTEPANPASGRVEKPAEKQLADKAAGDKVDESTVTISKDELAQLQRLAAREETRDKARRADLVKALLATGRKGFDEKALNAKSTDELENLALFVEAEVAEPTFAGPGNFAMSREAVDNDAYVPVDPWGTKDKALLAAIGFREAS